MRIQTLTSLFIVMAVLFVMAVASQVFVDDVLKPASLFGVLVVSTFFTGNVASWITEKIGPSS